VLLVGASGCGLVDPGPSDFIIHVTSFEAPAAVSSGAPFTVKISGPVGPDGCSGLKEVRVTQTANTVDIVAIGTRHTSSGTMCTMMPVYLDQHPVTVSPPIGDPFHIRIHRPDRTLLAGVIRVE
jgi:hypothetical protein